MSSPAISEEAQEAAQKRMSRALREIFTVAASRTGQAHGFQALPGKDSEVLESLNYLKSALLEAGLAEDEVTFSMSSARKAERKENAPKEILPEAGLKDDDTTISNAPAERKYYWQLDKPFIKLKTLEGKNGEDRVQSIINCLYKLAEKPRASSWIKEPGAATLSR